MAPISMVELTAPPARASLGDLRTGETIAVFANPEELDAMLAVNYVRQGVQGLSHEPLQYKNTGNQRINLALYCCDLEEPERIDDFERFLLSLCYAPESPGEIPFAGPPDVLLLWPQLISMRMRVVSLNFKFVMFASDGGALRYSAELELEEIRTVRLTSQEVRRNGFRRSGAAPGDVA